MVQICHNNASVLAQDNKEYLEIKNVIENFIKSIARQDINSAMNSVSANYSYKRKNEIVDYARFKSIYEKHIASVSKKYIDRSITYLNIVTPPAIQGNKATLRIEYGWKGFNLDTLKEVNRKLRRSVSLAKEGGTWKITKWSRLRKAKQ